VRQLNFPACGVTSATATLVIRGATNASATATILDAVARSAAGEPPHLLAPGKKEL
jgi:hypothetical protein